MMQGMGLLRLVIRNALRHRLRTALTVCGIALAVLAFGVLRTVVSAWHSGVSAAAPDRLVARSRISITFTLPVAQREKIARIPGVTGVTSGTWFGGIYKDPKNFFAQIALEGVEAFDFWPEMIVDPGASQSFGATRNGAVVGVDLMRRFGWKVGDVIRLQGTIYPGDWDFVICGAYRGRDERADESQFLFHWRYIEQRMAQESPMRTGQVGWWVIKIDDPARAAAICRAVDAEFRNSSDETLTETEAAFQQSFVAMAGTIILALQVISFLVIGVILLVAANTMAMTARERVPEYAVLKTLGFQGAHILGLIAGESVLIAGLGGAGGVLLMIPMLKGIGIALHAWVPAFPVEPLTYAAALGAALGVGVLAAALPAWRAVRVSIVDGLRRVD
jgi:putative ABC transport system permease protein